MSTTNSTNAQTVSIADMFGLSSSKIKRQAAENTEAYEYVPPNVRQQIELWEKELNCVEDK